jgi:hypothetical protein
MTDRHVRRLYALSLGILVLFLAWAVVVAQPWSAPAAPAQDPRIVALQRRELRLRREAVAVQRAVAHRWQVYRVQLHRRQRAIDAARRQHLAQVRAAAAQAHAAAAAAAAAVPVSAASAPVAAAAPAVRVVTLPPITVTRSS